MAPVYLTRDGSKVPSGSVADPAARFGLLYNIIAPPDDPAGMATVYLYIYWPAQAPPTAASTGHYEVTTSFALP
jgi:hypothetical protein